MRIRRNPSRFLGSAFSVPAALSLEIPPPPCLALCSASPGSHDAAGISSSTTASKEVCGLSISPRGLSAFSAPATPSPEIPPPPCLAPCSASPGSHDAAGISSSTTASKEVYGLSISPWGLSAFSTPAALSPEIPPPPCLAPCLASPGSHSAPDISSSTTASKEVCGLSISPWDLYVSNPQMVDGLLDSYCVEEAASCLFPDSTMSIFLKKKKKSDMFVASKDKEQLPAPKTIVVKKKKKKTPEKVTMKPKEENKESKAKMCAKVKKVEGKEGPSQLLKCKKNDGRGWYCKKTVSHPNSLCDHHIKLKRSYMNREFSSTIIEEEKNSVTTSKTTSKPSNSSKTRKKKPTNHFNTTKGFYHYFGFGPLHGKRHYRSTIHDSTPPTTKVEVELPKDSSPLGQAIVEVDDGTNEGVATYDDALGYDDNDNIAGIEQRSSDDNYDPCFSSHNSMNKKRNKNPWKHWRKPMKARSLNSLL